MESERGVNKRLREDTEGDYEIISDNMKYDEECGGKSQDPLDWVDVQTSEYVLRSRTIHEQFIQNLPTYDFFAEDFIFSLSRNQQLSKDEMNELYDVYGVSKSERVGRKGYSLSVSFRIDKHVKKCVLLFVREIENHQFNVIQAEAENRTEINWSRLATASGAAFGASFLCALINPVVGGFTFATSGLALAGKYVRDSKQHHQYQNLVIGYMIRELEKESILVFQDGHCFLREGGQQFSINTLNHYGGVE